MPGPGVLQVLRSAGGGKPAQVRLLVEGLLHRGFGAAVACPDRMRGVLEGTGALVYPLPGDISPAGDLADVLRLASLLRTCSFGLVHAHGPKAALVSLVAARLAGRVRAIYTDYGTARDGCLGYLRQKAAGGVLRRYDCLVAVSRHTRRAISGLYGLDPAQVQVIHHGIEVPRSIPASREPWPGSAPLVGMAARLAPWQGVEVFLRAAGLIRREWPRVRFLVAGGGPLWPELKKLAEDCGLAGHLIFTGHLGEAAGLMSLLDVCVFPSGQVGLPELLEAMAWARPVVAGCSGGIPEVLGEGTGLLVPPGDAAALASQVVRFLNHPRLAQELGRAACQRVLSRFGVARMQEETTALYRRVLAGEFPSRAPADMESVPGA